MKTTEALIYQYKKLHKTGADTSDLFVEIKRRTIGIGYDILPKYVYGFHYKEDVFAELDLHLHLGILAFRSNRKVKFNTYIYYWFQKAIFKYISNKTRLIRFPQEHAGKIEENIILRPKKNYNPFINLQARKIDIDLNIQKKTVNKRAQRLSDLEFQVLELYLQGFTFREIRDRLKPNNSFQLIHKIYLEAIEKLKKETR